MRDATPPGTRRRDVAQAELKQAVDGREHEFIGIALILVGVLLGLATYFDLAGPLGRSIESFVGWFVGLGRFILPLILVSAGVALVKKGQSSSPTRLVIGWGLVGRRRARSARHRASTRNHGPISTTSVRPVAGSAPQPQIRPRRWSPPPAPWSSCSPCSSAAYS